MYETTPPGSSGRRPMVDLWAAYGKPEFSDLNHPSHSNFGGVVELVESEQWLT
jgi:hypothetical protein